MNDKDIRAQFNDQGYVICKKLISDEKIDKLSESFEVFKKSKLPYYSQSIHTWIPPEIDNKGFMKESMENFTRVLWLKKLALYGNDILLGKEIDDVLKILMPEIKLFAQWQNMLFDKSTGTIDHYDGYYLDTFPNGYLIGAWIALEDIDKRSGAFKVFPGSQNFFSSGLWNELPHENFRKKCKEYADKNKFKHALLQKGDALFWHPALLHGASEQTDESYSRKSLTSHYYPYGYGRKNDGIRKSMLRDFQSKVLYRPTKIRDYPILSSSQPLKDFVFSSKGFFEFLIGSLTGKIKIKNDMKRSSH